MDFIIPARTSGEEKSTGQNIGAQVAEVRAWLQARGHTVFAEIADDEGVSGDTDPFTRKGLKRAVALAKETGKPLAFREFARFSRAYPPQALLWFDRLGAEGVRVLCIADPEFSTLEEEDPAAQPAPMMVGMRMMKAIFGWSYLVSTRTGTQRAMDGIADGTRKTKSGRPPGRPSVVDRLSEEERAWCVAELAKPGASLLKVHASFLERRRYHGPNAFTDPKAKKKAFVSYDTLARALGLRKPSAKRTLPQNPEPPSAGPLVRNGPVVRTTAEASAGHGNGREDGLAASAANQAHDARDAGVNFSGTNARALAEGATRHRSGKREGVLEREPGGDRK